MSKERGGGTTPLLQNLQLTTLDDTRESYERIIQAYAEGLIPESNLRALVYALSGYLSYWKLLKEVELEKRLDEIEVLLNEKRQTS